MGGIYQATSEHSVLVVDVLDVEKKIHSHSISTTLRLVECSCSQIKEDRPCGHGLMHVGSESCPVLSNSTTVAPIAKIFNVSSDEKVSKHTVCYV